MNKLIVILAVTLLSINAIAQTKQLKCESIDTFDGQYMYRTVSFNSKLAKSGENSFTLSSLRLDYALSMDEELSGDWASANVFDENYTITNNEKYNPRVYKDHVNFADLYSKEIFGYIDLILPKSALNSKLETVNFTGYTIMTWMDDHWGGTVTLSCSLSPVTI